VTRIDNEKSVASLVLVWKKHQRVQSTRRGRDGAQEARRVNRANLLCTLYTMTSAIEESKSLIETSYQLSGATAPENGLW